MVEEPTFDDEFTALIRKYSDSNPDISVEDYLRNVYLKITGSDKSMVGSFVVVGEVIGEDGKQWVLISSKQGQEKQTSINLVYSAYRQVLGM